MARIDFQMNFNANKNGLNDISTMLKDIQQQALKAGKLGTLTNELEQASIEAKKLETILNQAWNSKLNQLDLSKVNQSIKTTYGSVNQLKNKLESVGQGRVFNQLQSDLLSTNLQLKQSNKLLDEMATSMANTVKWGITSSIFNNITNQIQKAWTYTKQLDTSLNDIRIVTDKSADSMERFARQANEAAKNLGTSTKDYTDASLIYYQQGLSDEETRARTETTLKAANVTGQASSEVSEQLTAIWNGYKVTAEETELYIDKVAKVAAATAADLEELSTGMSKVASAASTMGVDVDQLNALLATTISVTREAPETVGTSFRTIFARMTQLKADGTDEFGVTLGRVSTQLESMGIQILDQQGEMRDLGTVITEVGEQWQNWSEAQKVAAAQAMAGTQQYSRLMAVFENWDMYNEALTTSKDAVGTLNEQQSIYMESTEAHLQKLSTEAEKTYDILFDQDIVNGFTDALTGALGIFNNFLDVTGGGLNTLLTLGSMLGSLFSKQIGSGISQHFNNKAMAELNQSNAQAAYELAQQDISTTGVTENEAEVYKREIEYSRQLLELSGSITTEKYNELNTLKHNLAQDELRVAAAYDYMEALEQNENYTQDLTKELKLQTAQVNDLKKVQKDLLGTYKSINELNEAHVTGLVDADEMYNHQLEIMDELLILNDAGLLTDEQQIQYMTLLNTFTNDELLDEEQILKTKQIINEVIGNEIAKEEQLKRQKEAQKLLESGELTTLEKRIQLQEKILKASISEEQRNMQAQVLVSTLMNGVTLVTTLSGLWKTMADDSISSGEKMTQLFSTVIMLLPTIISTVKSFKELPVAIGTLIPLFTGITSAEFAASVAAQGFGAALWGALLPILPIILAVAAAIAAVVGVGYALVKAFNADADAAKAAAQASKDAATAAEEAKEAYEELKETVSAYDEAVNAMKKLSSETDEYKEKLKEANDAAMELMKNNPELISKAKRNAQGLIEFEGIDTETLLKQSSKSVNIAEGAASVAQAQANTANLKNQRTEFIRSNEMDWWWDLKAFFTGDALNDDQLQKIIEIINTQGGLTEDDLKGIVGSNKSLINTLMETDNKQELINLANSTKQLNDTNKLLLDKTLRSSLENNTTYVGMSEAEKNAVAEIYGEGLTDEKRAEIEKQARDKWYQDKAFGGGNEDLVHSEYAKARGWTLSKNKAGDKAVYVDSEGNEHEISDDTAREYLVQRQISEQTGKYDEDTLNKMMSGIQKVSTVGTKIDSEIGTELLGFITGKDTTFDATQITQDQIDKLKQKIQSGELLGDLQNVTAEEWAAMGVNNAEEYITKIQEGITNFKPNWDLEYQTNAGQAEQSQSVLNILSKGDESDLEDDQLAYLKQLESEYEVLGEIQDRTSHEYLQTLREIKEQQEANASEALKNSKKQQEEDLKTNLEKLDELKKEYDSLSEDEKNDPNNKKYIELVAKTDEIEEALKKLEDTKYQIKVQVDADLASDVEDAFGIADELTQLQDAVSEDLTYTFEEAQELIAKGYGEMFTNAKETSENTIQVNKDVMNSFIDSRQAEIEADRQAKIDQLETQKTYLKTQRDALVQKLNALKEAASAETAVDAATAMEKVNNANIAYEAATNALNEELNDEAEGATENQKINAELYNALGGMYEENVENENQAEADATNNQQANINKRIENVHALHNAYSNLARQVKASESGEVIPVGNESATGSGVNAAPTGSTNIEANTQTANEISIEDLKSKTEALFNNNQTQYKDTINALIKSTQAEIDAIDAQIGAADAGIAALKSSGKSLDKAQKDAKVGGKGSDKDPDKEDAIENEKDLYHDVNIELEQISTTLGRLQKQQDKLFGKNLIENLNAQIETLNDQIETTGEKIKIAEGEAAGLKASLSGQGVIFNADGTIANYAAAYEAQLAYVNSIIAQYNAMDAESQEAYKETVEQAKANFEKFVDNIENYDTLISETIPGLQDEIQDAINEQIELQIQKFNMEIELRLDLAEAEREWNEFKKRIIDGIDEDDILGNAKARLQDFNSYYKVDGTGSVQAGTKQVNSILEQLRQIDETGTSSVYGDNKQKALEDLDTYYTQLISDLNDLADLQEEIHQAYLDMMDEAQEKFDEQLEVYDQISSLIEHDMKLIELVGGEDSYAELSEYYNKQHENNLAQLDFQRQQVDFWKQQMDAAEEGSDKWESAKEKWMEAIEDWRSSVEEAVEAIQDKYLNAINLIFQGLNDKVTNGMGLEYVSEEWELINANADQYLDTINSMYEIQSLESKYLDAIDQTDSISAQRKLNDLMQQELSALEEKDKLTQYDIDRANMKYEIALKQIALEEAQQNKSSMRLRRDSQGNYTYQFVSDQDAIGQAQDELSALQNELYNFDLEKYRNNLDELYQIWEEYQQKMAEAAQINDPEERAARELLLNEQYGELINGLVEQNATIRVNLNESAFAELADLYNVDVANFEQLSLDEQDILMNDMVPQWNSGIQQMADVFAGEGGFTAVCEEAMNQLAEATEIYEDDLQEVEETSGITFDTIADGTDNAITQTQDLLADNDELINSYERELEAVQAVIDKMDTLIGKYKSAEAAAKAASEAAYKYEQEEKRKAAEEAAKENAKNTSNNTTTLSSNNTATTPTSGGTGSSGGGDGNLQVGDTATYSGKYYYDSYGTSPAGSRYSGVTNGVKVDILNNNPYGAHIRSADGKFPDLGWVKKSQLSGFDTGGYTGNWGDSSGRLALLHQKELVLNANDTTNMLSALKILEGIVGTVGSSMLTRLANLGSGIGAPMSDISASSDTLEQNVHIEASFPNVQNSKEIEDAFNNLVNIASQRVHRNKR